MELEAISLRLDQLIARGATTGDAAELLMLGEYALEQWVIAKGRQPTEELREGFRLLALHRQGADKEPSFNACRETCRELVYHYNVLTLPGASPSSVLQDEPQDGPDAEQTAKMMAWVARHLVLFITGKMESEQLGVFCCASKPLRETVDAKSNAH